MRRKWTEEEIALLKLRIVGGASVAEMAAELRRSENSVRMYLKKHRIRRKGANTLWTPEEETAFREDWKNSEISSARLVKKYGRSRTALRQKAGKLRLGRRPVSDFFLTKKELKEALGVSDSKLASWIRQGLPVHKSRSNRSYGALYDADEALQFLQDRQDEFDGSLLDDSYFWHIPPWLREKCRRDCARRNWNYRKPWTNDENRRLVHLFESGKTDEEIAELLGRSGQSIRAHRIQMGLTRQRVRGGKA